MERVPRQKAITHKVFCQPDGPSQSTLPDSGVNVVAAAGMLITVAISAATAARNVQSPGRHIGWRWDRDIRAGRRILGVRVRIAVRLIGQCLLQSSAT
jgi:hypothetical protein